MIHNGTVLVRVSSSSITQYQTLPPQHSRVPFLNLLRPIASSFQMQTFRTVRTLSNGHILRPPIRQASYSTMKALVYRAVGDVKLEERPKPKISQPTDAIIKLTKSTICGTDLHISKGDVATCTPGTILGHEGVGIIDEIGNSVRGFKKGEHVLISCICSCATCEYCRKGMYSHCTTGGS
jgi:hypothetical protein